MQKTSFRKLELDQKLQMSIQMENEGFVEHALMHLTAKETDTSRLSGREETKQKTAWTEEIFVTAL